MKTRSIRFLSAAVLACLSTAAFAAPDVALQQPRVEVIVERTALDAAQAVMAQSPFDQTYSMSTGRRLAVASHGSALKVRYGAKPTTLLRHDGMGWFISTDGALALRFALDEVGAPQAVRLHMPAQWQ